MPKFIAPIRSPKNPEEQVKKTLSRSRVSYRGEDEGLHYFTIETSLPRIEIISLLTRDFGFAVGSVREIK